MFWPSANESVLPLLLTKNVYLNLATL